MSAFDHTELDEVIHGRLRLGTMAFLSTAGAAGFVELRGKVNATDGNLSAHLQKLEEAGYVRLDKTFAGKKPLTTVVLTDAGRSAWIAYLDRLQKLLKESS